MKKLLYIVSDVDKALAFEWTALCLKRNYQLSFILIGKQGSVLEHYLHQIEVPCFVISDGEYAGYVSKYWKLIHLFIKLKPSVVHTHLWRANLLGLPIAWLLRVEKRIITRHHALTHYREFPSGRKWDKLCNFLATDIIAISESIKTILVDYDKAKVNKIQIIHHGFDLQELKSVSEDRVDELRIKYNIDKEKNPVIGVISRYLKWKGIQYIILAFQRILNDFPNAILVMANAKGDFNNEIKELLSEISVTNYKEIEFENDLPALYKLFDVFVHAPIDSRVEAFGQTYVEALVAGVPSVFTLSGVATEFIVHEQNALVVPFQSIEPISAAIKRILNDDLLKNSLIKEGSKSADLFPIEKMISSLIELYEK